MQTPDSPEPVTDPLEAAIKELQSSLIELSLNAAPGGLIRAVLAKGASFTCPPETNPFKGISRKDVAELFHAVAMWRMTGDRGHALSHMLRYLDEAMSYFERAPE